MSIVMGKERDAFIENLAAELTSAAYPVVLRHGVGDQWLDLQLDLWKAMIETVKRLDYGVPAPASGTLPKTSEFFG